MSSRTAKHYEEIFQHSPVAIVEMDLAALVELGQRLKDQTVTNIRQYLIEQPQIVKKTFHEFKINEANQAALQLYHSQNITELRHQLSKAFFTTGFDVLIELLVALLSGEYNFSGEFKFVSANKKFRDVFLRTAIPKPYQKRLSRVILSLQDITIWKRIERQLRRRAQLDGLTNLLNHNTITQRLDEELIRAKRYGLSLSCMMIDLDDFKIINDKFGHQRGDAVLRQVAHMIRNCVRKSEVVGRYGGDEFLIILPETTSRNAFYAAQRVHNLFLAKQFRYRRLISFHIALSIGISGYPSPKVKEAKDMITLADKAMYESKTTGRSHIAIR